MLLVEEEGMFLIFERIRMFAGVYYTALEIKDGKQQLVPVGNEIVLSEMKQGYEIEYIKQYKNEFAKLFSCVWCMSVWVSVVINLIWFLTYKTDFYLIDLVYFSLATSAIAMVLKQFLKE
jgi:hypothetical protein